MAAVIISANKQVLLFLSANIHHMTKECRFGDPIKNFSYS